MLARKYALINFTIYMRTVDFFFSLFVRHIVNPTTLQDSTSLFEKPPISHGSTCFVFKSKHFYFTGLIKAEHKLTCNKMTKKNSNSSSMNK
jgi:hypothetical protein